jgi:hypothetical protein
VFAIAASIQRRYRLLDDGIPMLHIVRAFAELDSGARRLKGPKSTGAGAP